MALDSTKWSVNSSTKEILYNYATYPHGNAGANYVTVLELHRWLQDLADNASSSGDDFMDITRETPSEKQFETIITLTNGFYINDTTAEYIYGGSIIQNDGGGESIFDGVRVVANRGCYLDIIQDGARITNDFWNSTPSGETFRGINFNASLGVSAQFMVKVKNDGLDIDSKRLLFQTREWGKTYSEFKIPGTGRGVNVVPLTYADDLNNTTSIGSMTSAPFTTVTNVTAGFNLIDVDNNGSNEEYYSEWNKGDCTINQFYEYMKYITRRTAVTTTATYGVPGELFRGITHSVTYTGQAGGNFSQGVTTKLTWTGGEGYILADNDGGTTGTLYIQLLKGVAPTGTLTQGAVTASTGTVTEKVVSTPFCGQSTGSSLVGAYGFSLEYTDLAKNDKIVAFDGVTRSPPNNATFTVSNLVAGYSVLVAPYDAVTGIDYNQFTLNGTLSGAAVTSVVVNTTIPDDTPTTGTIRIKRANGAYTKHSYSAWSGTTFTIASTDFSTNNATTGTDVFISYIDNDSVSGTSVSYSAKVVATRDLYVRVRFGGTGPNYTDAIKTFQTTSQFKDGGNTAGAVITSDA